MILGRRAKESALTDRIRDLFLHPHPTYSIADAASVLGMDVREVQGWVEAGELEDVETESGLVLPWAEVVSFAMDLWSQEVIEEALGDDLELVIPELVRLTLLEVRVPRFEIVALERVAGREGKSVDAVLARELLDFVSVHSPWIGMEIAGFAEALQWPE
jgi:hypothetical protein